MIKLTNSFCTKKMDLAFKFLQYSSCPEVMTLLILNLSRALSALVCKVWKRLSESIASLSVLHSSVELWLADVYFCLHVFQDMNTPEVILPYSRMSYGGGGGRYFNLVSRYFTIFVEGLEMTINISSSFRMSCHVCPSLKDQDSTKEKY